MPPSLRTNGKRYPSRETTTSNASCVFINCLCKFTESSQSVDRFAIAHLHRKLDFPLHGKQSSTSDEHSLSSSRLASRQPPAPDDATDGSGNSTLVSEPSAEGANGVPRRGAGIISSDHHLPPPPGYARSWLQPQASNRSACNQSHARFSRAELVNFRIQPVARATLWRASWYRPLRVGEKYEESANAASNTFPRG
jgi:hypothetical protein